MLWAYIDFNRGQSVEDIPVMLSEKYLGENVNGFRCTGAFMEKPDRDDLREHIRSYAVKYLKEYMNS